MACYGHERAVNRVTTGHRTQEFQYRRISSQADADRQCYRKSFARQRTCPSALEEGVSQGVLPGWNIEVRNKIDMAASVSGEDTVRYVEWPSMGATCAVHVRATSADGKQMADGWVSCGSFLFPYQALRLDSVCSLVMPDREPRRFSSEVTIYTETGKNLSRQLKSISR